MCYLSNVIVILNGGALIPITRIDHIVIWRCSCPPSRVTLLFYRCCTYLYLYYCSHIHGALCNLGTLK